MSLHRHPKQTATNLVNSIERHLCPAVPLERFLREGVTPNIIAA